MKKQIYELTISNQPYPFLDRIIDESKKIEGRTNSRMFQNMNVGDFLKLFNHEKWAFCQIKGLRVYGSFRQMLEGETLERVLPGYQDLDSAVAMYRKFPRFLENEKRFGVVAIEIKKIESGLFE